GVVDGEVGRVLPLAGFVTGETRATGRDDRTDLETTVVSPDGHERLAIGVEIVGDGERRARRRDDDEAVVTHRVGWTFVMHATVAHDVANVASIHADADDEQPHGATRARRA